MTFIYFFFLKNYLERNFHVNILLFSQLDTLKYLKYLNKSKYERSFQFLIILSNKFNFKIKIDTMVYVIYKGKNAKCIESKKFFEFLNLYASSKMKND